MKLKVEIQWQGQPWRRRIEVKWLSVADAIFGVLVSILYISKLSFDLNPELPVLKPSDRWNNSLALVFLVAANLLQVVHAFGLCYVVTRMEGRDPVNCHKAAKNWFDFTEFSYLFMIVKCIASVGYVLKVAAHPWILILTAITLPECIFKLYMLYVVHCFMQDLRESLKYLPKFNFIPIRSSSPDLLLMEQNEKKMEPDFNANTQLLV